jgi:uncharacterized protein (DUF488 family)
MICPFAVNRRLLFSYANLDHRAPTRTIDDFFVAEGKRDKLACRRARVAGLKRYPQFNKDALAESLNAHGIRYEHFPELGGKRKSSQTRATLCMRRSAVRRLHGEQFQKGVERLLPPQERRLGQPSK